MTIVLPHVRKFNFSGGPTIVICRRGKSRNPFRGDRPDVPNLLDTRVLSDRLTWGIHRLLNLGKPHFAQINIDDWQNLQLPNHGVVFAGHLRDVTYRGY